MRCPTHSSPFGQAYGRTAHPPCVRFDGGFRPSFPGCAQLRIQVVEPCGEFFRKATGVTNTRVVWCFSTSSSTLRSMAGHTEPPVETREVCSSPRPKSVLYVPPMPPWQDPPRKYAWYGGSEVSRRLPSALRRRRRDRAWPKAVPPLSDPCRGADSGLMTRTGRVPPRKRAASAGGSTVAESPMRWTDRPARLSNRSKLSARCAPRLSPRWRALHPR